MKQVNKRIKNILKNCFWDYDFNETKIKNIIKSDNLKKKIFLFNKILENSNDMINNLQIFKKKDLEYLIKLYKPPKFNFNYLNTRHLILKSFYLGEDVNIPFLSWKK